MRFRFFLVPVLVTAVGACAGGSATPDAAGSDVGQPAGQSGSAPPPDAAAGSGGAGGTGTAVDAQGSEPPVVPAEAPDGGATPAPDGAPRDVAPDLAPDAAGARTIGELYCAPMAGAYPNPLPANLQPTLVPIAPPGGITFLEGPVWLADRGVLLLSEWNSGHRILQLTPPSAVEVFLPASGTNGLALTPDGKSLLMVTEMPAAGVSRLTLADKKVQKVVESYNGQAFVQPNDLVVRADGVVYFTDYQAGRLYRRATDGTLTLLASLPHSNGVALSPDERTLYLNSDARTVRYPVTADGAVGAGTDLATGILGADGLAIDCAGNVYIAQNAGGAVVVVSAAGTKLGELTGLPKAVTNAAFGGADRRTLYITTSSALYTLTLQVPGLPY